MVFFEILLGVAIFVGLIVGVIHLCTSAITARRAHKSAKLYYQKKRELEAAKKNRIPTWEEEFVSSLRAAHHVTKIEPQKYVFRFGKPDGPQVNGWQWTCKCGAKNGLLDLEGSERLYKKHLKEEAEKAAASLGKFKLPAGIDWSFDPEGK